VYEELSKRERIAMQDGYSAEPLAVSPGRPRPTLMESLDRLDVEIERSKALLMEFADVTERTHSAIDLYWRRLHDRRAAAVTHC
jgi:hypothetical protein